MSEVRISAAGDAVLVAELDERIDPLVNARAVALAGRLRGARLAGVRDIVTTFRSVAVYFDPVGTNREQLLSVVEELAAADPAAGEAETAGRLIELPVCYDREFAPDLDDVARRTGLDGDTVVALHLARTYRVFMLGFVPGFAYLGLLDRRLAIARRETPRAAVEPGSVAIAGEQTGVYPSRTPGGWHVIGRTPVEMFSPDRPESALLSPGDRVRFRRVEREEFERLASAQGRAA